MVRVNQAPLLIFLCMVFSIGLSAQNQEKKGIETSCKAENVKIENGDRRTWLASCQIIDYEKPEIPFIYSSYLPLPLPATYDEAMKAIDLFMKKTRYKILKDAGYPVPKGKGK